MNGKVSGFEKNLAGRIVRGLRGPVRLRFWDGTEISNSAEPAVATVILRDRKVLIELAFHPDLYFGEAYSTGRLEIEGDLVSLLEIVYRSRSQLKRQSLSHRLTSAWHDWWHRNTLNGSHNNIHHHYDIRGDFYRLWLDRQLLYTCAYYPSPSETLENAQIAKMDHVCRKVRLQPGDTVVEAGCGWGALALHMARNYGAQVKAFNISREQIEYARERARRESLADRVEFIQDDYRNVSGQFDVFMSVGMLEHVGREHYREFGEVVGRTLKEKGRGFLHFIGRNRQLPLNPWIRKRIFPGAYPPTLRDVMDIFEPYGVSVLDLENLRLHYARTLEHWLERFEASTDQVRSMFNAGFVRAWRLYLAGSLVAFRTGWLQLFQIAFTRHTNNDIPWTRNYLYNDTPEPDRNQKWIHAMS